MAVGGQESSRGGFGRGRRRSRTGQEGRSAGPAPGRSAGDVRAPTSQKEDYAAFLRVQMQEKQEKENRGNRRDRAGPRPSVCGINDIGGAGRADRHAQLIGTPGPSS